MFYSSETLRTSWNHRFRDWTSCSQKKSIQAKTQDDPFKQNPFKQKKILKLHNSCSNHQKPLRASWNHRFRDWSLFVFSKKRKKKIEIHSSKNPFKQNLVLVSQKIFKTCQYTRFIRKETLLLFLFWKQKHNDPFKQKSIQAKFCILTLLN